MEDKNIKLEVGKRYELNNGEVHDCTEMRGDDPLAVDGYGFGPFVIAGFLYHQDGTFADRGSTQDDYGVKRCVDDAAMTTWVKISDEATGEIPDYFVRDKWYKVRGGREFGGLVTGEDGSNKFLHYPNCAHINGAWEVQELPEGLDPNEVGSNVKGTVDSTLIDEVSLGTLLEEDGGSIEAGEVKGDMVNSPSHYGQGKIECIDYIKDFLTHEEFIGYLRGNIAKYLHRWRYKNGLEDLQKAQVYLEWLVEEVRNG